MKKINSRLLFALIALSFGSVQAETITCASKALNLTDKKDQKVIYKKSENEIENVFVSKFNQWTETGSYNHPVKAKLEYKDKTYKCKFRSRPHSYNRTITYNLDGYMDCGPFTFFPSVPGKNDPLFDFGLDPSKKYNLKHPHWAKWALFTFEKNEEGKTGQDYLVLNLNSPAPFVAGSKMDYQLAPNLDRCKVGKSIPSNYRKGYMCIESVVCKDMVSITTISQDIMLVHDRIAKVLSGLFDEKYRSKSRGGIYATRTYHTWEQRHSDMKEYLNKHRKAFENSNNLVMKLTVITETPYEIETIISPL